jgi:hypothetical protein
MVARSRTDTISCVATRAANRLRSPLVTTWQSDNTSVVLTDAALATPRLSAYLVLKADVLTEGATYVFFVGPSSSREAQVRHQEECLRQHGTGEEADEPRLQVIVEVNRPPTGDSLAVSPASGVSFETQFQLTADAWVDEQLPLSYAFSALATLDSRELILCASSNRTACQVGGLPTQC